MTIGNDPTQLDARSVRPTIPREPLANWATALWVVVITGGVFISAEVHHVEARVASIEESRKSKADDDRDARDRLIRIETTVELMARKMGIDPPSKGSE